MGKREIRMGWDGMGLDRIGENRRRREKKKEKQKNKNMTFEVGR